MQVTNIANCQRLWLCIISWVFFGAITSSPAYCVELTNLRREPVDRQTILQVITKTPFSELDATYDNLLSRRAPMHQIILEILHECSPEERLTVERSITSLASLEDFQYCYEIIEEKLPDKYFRESRIRGLKTSVIEWATACGYDFSANFSSYLLLDSFFGLERILNEGMLNCHATNVSLPGNSAVYGALRADMNFQLHLTDFLGTRELAERYLDFVEFSRDLLDKTSAGDR